MKGTLVVQSPDGLSSHARVFIRLEDGSEHDLLTKSLSINMRPQEHVTVTCEFVVDKLELGADGTV